MSIWGMMEMLKDPHLFKAIRSQVLEKCLRVDPLTGARSLNTVEMLKIPLLQSLSTEILRLHISVNVTREVTEPFSLGTYSLEKGDLLQAPSQIAHYDEEVWGEEGHRASEFWAERHISYTESINAAGQTVRQAEFSMTGRAGAFFPYGKYIQTNTPTPHSGGQRKKDADF